MNVLGQGLTLVVGQVGFFPPKASTAAEGIDEVFALIFWICAFFFALSANNCSRASVAAVMYSS